MKRPLLLLTLLLAIPLALVAATGAAPRYLEELRIGGGLDDPADGGADFEKDGDIATDGNLTLRGDASIGLNEAVDHSLSILAGASNDTYVNLNDADATHGGALSYDGSANKLYLGTRNGAATVTNALEIAAGSPNLTLPGDLTLRGGNFDFESDGGIADFAFWSWRDSAPRGRFIALSAKGSKASPATLVSGSSVFRIDARGYDGAAYQSAAWLEAFVDGAITQGSSFPGRWTFLTTPSGSVTPAEAMIIDGAKNLTVKGDATAEGGDLIAGTDSGTRGVVTAWDGSGGSAPGALKLASPNGTVWYLFVEDDGTVRIHNSLPTANTSGTMVGTQF